MIVKLQQINSEKIKVLRASDRIGIPEVVVKMPEILPFLNGTSRPSESKSATGECQPHAYLF